MPTTDTEPMGPLLHGTARAWRLKLDERLKPLGMSQARWRTLYHLSLAEQPVTQAEIAARLGIEEPTLVNILHRLEDAGWVKRSHSQQDRRCKTVTLGRRARSVIAEIDATAKQLRNELISGVRPAELEICMRVLRTVQAKAEDAGPNERNGKRRT